MNEDKHKKGNRVVLVTGGSRGIGAAISLDFAGCGYSVVVNYLSNRARAEALVEKIRGAGGDAFPVRADVSKAEDVAEMVATVVDRYGRIDVLVNNAGIAKGGFLMLIDEATWQDVIDTNLRGVFNTCKSVMPHMIDAKRGAIVNVSSLSGITGLAGQVPYSAAKGGVIALTRALAKEVAHFGILVNAVAPGVIETDMTEEMTDKDKQRFIDNIPLGRFGTPEEVSGVVLFLASSAAGYITGETIVVSGGIP